MDKDINECDLVKNRVLICMQLTAEEPILPSKPKQVFSFAESIEAYKPHIEIELIDGDLHEREILEIRDYNDLSFCLFLEKSKIVKRILECLDSSLMELHDCFNTDERFPINELRPLLIEDVSGLDRRVVYTNLQFAFYALKVLQLNYIKLAQFFYSIPNYHYACPPTPVSLFNASIEQLSDIDIDFFIRSIDDELSSCFDRLDNREAYSIVLLPDKFIVSSQPCSGHENIYASYLGICKKYNVLFISEYRDEYNFSQSLIKSGKYNSSWYFMSTELIGADVFTPDFKIHIGYSHLLCAYIVSNNWFYYNNLTCDRRLPFIFFQNAFSWEKKDSHYFYLDYLYSTQEAIIDNYHDAKDNPERKMSFHLRPTYFGGGDVIYAAITTNAIKVFANKLLYLINESQFDRALLNDSRKQYFRFLREMVEKEIELFMLLVNRIKFNWKFRIDEDEFPIHTTDFMIINPVPDDVYYFKPVDLKMQITLIKHEFNYSVNSPNKNVATFESSGRFTIHVSNYKRIGDKAQICNYVDVNYGNNSFW
jgi:hypothetical protein